MLADRLAKLRTRRQDVVQQRAAELARVDEQISFTQTLIDNWDTLTIDQALAALDKAGIRLRFDS